MKKWYQSRTIWLAILTSLSGIVVALITEYPEVGQLMVIKGVIDFTLRLATTESLFSK